MINIRIVNLQVACVLIQTCALILLPPHHHVGVVFLLLVLLLYAHFRIQRRWWWRRHLIYDSHFYGRQVTTVYVLYDTDAALMVRNTPSDAVGSRDH